MKIAVIIVAAGSSSRLKGSVHKPYRLINGKPILLHSLLTFAKIPSVSQIIIAVHPADQERANRLLKSQIPNPKSQIKVIIGGITRSHSVYNALQALSGLCSPRLERDKLRAMPAPTQAGAPQRQKDTDIVLVHDAARPFVTKPDIIKVINMVRRKGAAILARPVTDTIKLVSSRIVYRASHMPEIVRTIPRNTLWAAQTPQGFRKDIILRAYNFHRYHLADFTDDAGVVESIKKPVYIVEGATTNIKITTTVDLWQNRKMK